jgi:oxygen-dependent protoporphyrinogen oxidase
VSIPPSVPGTPPHVVVVGAGISGLAAAQRLRARRSDVKITIVEASGLIGGKLAQAQVGGVSVDTGAESLLNRRPEAVDLVRAVGLGDDVCYPVTTSASIWSRGALRPMPPTVLGVPSSVVALARSGVLTGAGLARAVAEPALPPTQLADDVSVGRFVTRRLGRDASQRLLEPLLGGVYAGHADELSLQAAAPQVASLAAKGGSLLRAAAATARARTGVAAVPVFAGIRGGIGRLPAAVAAASGAEVRTSSTVRELRRTAAGWSLVVGRADAPTTVSADAVVLATPAPATARLLDRVAPQAAADLRDIEVASVAVVTLAVPHASIAAELPGSGCLVPPIEGRAVKAATWSSRKWGWVAEAAGAGTAVLRCSFGRHRESALLQRDDAELVRLAVDELGDAVGVRGQLSDALVTRWGGGLPQYAVGHVARVERVRRAVADVRGLEVCGAPYEGIGIAACIADAQRAADRLVAGLDAQQDPPAKQATMGS